MDCSRSCWLYLALLSSVTLLGLVFAGRSFPGGSGAGAGRGKRRMVDLVKVPDLKRVFIASAVVMTGLDLFQLYMPLYGHRIGLSASAIGLVLGAILLTAAILWIRHHRKRGTRTAPPA